MFGSIAKEFDSMVSTSRSNKQYWNKNFKKQQLFKDSFAVCCFAQWYTDKIRISKIESIIIIVMSKINKKSGKQQATTADIEQEENLLDHQTEQQMRTLRNKHPDCIPILFSRHKAAPKSLKQPSVPFMLFKKDLKIEQAMYRLYQQIEQKGLYFFCLEVVKDKAKYRKIQAGPTIEQIYNKYGKNECLILIYGNSEMGLEGLQRMQKCMIWLIVIVGTIWLSLFLYNYFYVQGPQAQIKQQTLQP